MNKLKIAWFLLLEIIKLPCTDALIVSTDRHNKQEVLVFGGPIAGPALSCLTHNRICCRYLINPEGILKVYLEGSGNGKK